MVALIAALLSLPIEIGLSAGPGYADAQTEYVNAPMLRARVGVDLIENLSFNATLLGAAGSERARTFCSNPPLCRGSAGLRGISGLATVRLRNEGDLQGFVELGAGVGHLIYLSADEQFENPAKRGRGGLSLMLAAGGRWFVSRNLALGAALQWTSWTHVEQRQHWYGIDNIPAQSDLSASALALMFSIDIAPAR
jgi:hypothetical protein